MEKKKYAFMLLGAQYNPAQHCAHFETQGMDTYIVTVSSFEQAYEAVKKLDNMGVGALEVCGAFGEERAKELITLTKGRMAIGFVTHLPEQDELFYSFFGK